MPQHFTESSRRMATGYGRSPESFTLSFPPLSRWMSRNQADEYDYKLHYWRERDDEVDFVIDHYGRCIAIEVKSGRRTGNQGLGVFREKFHPAQAFVVGSGGVPVEEFLSWDLRKLIDL